MNHLLNITIKELRELLTIGTIASVVVVVVMFAVLGNAMSEETDKATAPPDIGVVYEGSPDDVIITSGGVALTYADLVQQAYVGTYGTDADLEHIKSVESAYGDNDAITAEISDKGYKFVLGIPSDVKNNVASILSGGEVKASQISMYYVYSDEGLFGTTSNEGSSAIVAGMSSIVSAMVISELSGLGLEASAVIMGPLVTASDSTYTLINGTVYSGITPYQIYSTQMGQTLMIPIVVMLIIMMVGSVVISSMGSEKENKTLETLLTCPVRRTTIVSGKLLAAAVTGLVYGVFYLMGMMFYTNGITSGISNTVNLSEYGLAMDAADWAVMFVILFLSIFAALGICMILGAFTKNYKMAQTMVMPVAILSMVPMFAFMFSSWSSLPGLFQAVLFAIPFSHPMMAVSNLMLGNTTLILGGIAYLAVFDAVLVYLTVRIYNSDILITGLDKVSLMRKLGINQAKVKKR